MSILLKLIYKFDAIIIRVPDRDVQNLDKLNLKLITIKVCKELSQLLKRGSTCLQDIKIY